MVNQYILISYALSFASFLLNNPFCKKINKIILFGSVARGDYTSESDIDIFVDAPDSVKKEIEKSLSLFYSSRVWDMWRLNGIDNEISLKIGNLAKWRLRREVISSGIMLYGKYTELPEHANPYLLIRIIDLGTKKISKQMHLWRRLYGYTQKIGNKTYNQRGIISEEGGIKIGKAILLIPMIRRRPILDFLKKNKIKYKLYELWSDSF